MNAGAGGGSRCSWMISEVLDGKSCRFSPSSAFLVASLSILLAKCSGFMVEPACGPGNPRFSLSGLGNLLLDPPSALFGVPASLIKL